MGIGERLRKFRQQAVLTQKQLEERSGVPQNTISRIESGHVQEISTKTLMGLARALQVSTDVLLGMDEPTTATPPAKPAAKRATSKGRVPSMKEA